MFYGKYDISVKCGKSRKYDIYVQRFYENVVFRAVWYIGNSQLSDEEEWHSLIKWCLILCFFTGLAFLSTLMGVNSLSCISMNNHECKLRPQTVSVNGDDPMFFPYSVKASKCSGSCNNTNFPLARLCVPDVVKSLNVKVFNLVSRTNETRWIAWYETCKCKCRLEHSVCNNKHRWNDDKCRCECK